MRNTSNCHKLPYLAMLMKLENDPGSTSRIRSTPKFNHFQRAMRCPCLPSLVDVHKHFGELSANRRTHRQTHTHRDTSQCRLRHRRAGAGKQLSIFLVTRIADSQICGLLNPSSIVFEFSMHRQTQQQKYAKDILLYYDPTAKNKQASTLKTLK